MTNTHYIEVLSVSIQVYIICHKDTVFVAHNELLVYEVKQTCYYLLHRNTKY